LFKSILLSIAVAPILLGIFAAKSSNAGRARTALRTGWAAYAVVLIGALYYLRHQ